jgi:hypothetical protein
MVISGSLELLRHVTLMQRCCHAYLLILDLYFCKCIIFWASNLTCTSCRTYTLGCGRLALGKCVNCLCALCPPNDKLLACVACWNILDWTNDWHSPQLRLADKWERNRWRSFLLWILFFLKTCFYTAYLKFSRILTSLFYSSLSDRLLLSVYLWISQCTAFYLQLSYSTDFFLFYLVCKV